MSTEKPSARRGQPALTIIVVVAGTLLSVGAWHAMQLRESKLFEAEFSRRAGERIVAVERELDRALVVIESLAAFHRASPMVDRDRFRAFTAPILARHSSIQALGYDVVIRAGDRALHEEATRREGFDDYRITERAPDGTLVPAQERDSYVVVHLMEPMEGNEAAFGFDIASEPVRREALTAAVQTGEAVATGRVTLVQETGGQFGVLICHPIFRDGDEPASEPERRSSLVAYVVGVVRVGDAVEHALGQLAPVGIDVHLLDASAPADPRLLHFHDGYGDAVAALDATARSALAETSSFILAGRRWRLECSPTNAYVAESRTWQPQATLAGGLLLTLLLAGYLHHLTALNRRLRNECVERALAESRLRLHDRAMESTSNGIILVDATGADHEIIYANPAFERMTGYAAQEVVGRNSRFLQRDDRDQPGLAELRAGIAEQRTARVIVRNYRKDGTLFWNEVFISPVRDDDGRVTHFVGIQNDITERKEAEEALRESEQRNRTLVENAPEAIAVLDLESGCFVDFNEHAVELFKLDREQLSGLGPGDLSPPLQPDGQPSGRLARDWASRAAAGEVPVFEWTHRDGAGRDIPCEVRLVRLPSSRRILIRGSVTDISQRKLDEQRQRLIMAELDHRVKNNLASVLYLADQTLATSPTLAAFGETFTGRIRALCRTHEALAQTRWEGVRIEQVLQQTIAPYEQIDGRRVAALGPNVLLPASASAPVTMTLHELATNAVKHGALSVPEGRVELTWSLEDGGRLRMNWIERGGPPVREPVQSGPQTRTQTGTQTRTGLGLSLIAGFIRFELQGEADFDFRPEGLSCSLVVPLDSTARSAAATAGPKAHDGIEVAAPP